MTEATELVAEIGLRFKSGDSAAELIARLEARLATLAPQMAAVDPLPDDLRDAIARLSDLIQTAVATGAGWLDQTGPELASQTVRQRLRRTYGPP